MSSADSEHEPSDAPAEVHAPEVHVPVSSDEHVFAPVIVERFFATWAAFFEYLEVYQDETHQVFKKRTSTSVEARNKNLAERGKITPATEIPSTFETYYRRLICTHGWSRASRSVGKRDSYFSKSTKCDAQLSVTVVWAGDMGFRVKGTQQLAAHNHALGQRVYENHPSNRRIEDPEVIDFVDEFQAAGAKIKLIMKYLRQRTGKQVTLRDVHNLVAKLKDARRGATTVESRLEFCLRDFCTQTGNTASIHVVDDKLAQTITFQTRQMRRFFEASPEVMMIDATHNTNDARYKLFSFMIHDVFGHGQYVQHALMENESSECLTDAVTSFKSFNPTWEEVRVIIVDKDFGEISLLQAQFPGARILLCVFHMVKYLRGEMAKREYGVFDREKVEDAVSMMLQAQTEAEYDTARKYLYYIVEGKQIALAEDIPEPAHPFLKYFHAMTSMQEELGQKIGLISPTFMGTSDAADRHMIIQKSQPFHERSDFVLLSLHVQGNHWCGAVFDLKATPGTITLFDPQQKKKQIDACEAIVEQLFPEMVSKMEIKHEKRLKQGDAVSCGPLMLHFFECTIRGFTLETSTISPALLRYIRLRYLLKSLHV